MTVAAARSDPVAPERLGVVALAQAIAAGRVSAVEAVQAALAQAERWRGLNAVVALEAERALEVARTRDRARAAGRLLGPIHGVPLAHKDMFDRAGSACEWGSAIARGRIAAETSPLVAALEAAGAITIGRLHMAECAMGPTGHNAQLGRCRNPWDATRVSGGSSSGSGAAVAAGIVPGSLGSDTGGSVRLPAAFCGVVGLKPTTGALPSAGMMPLSRTMDTAGPLARSTRDVARLFDTMVGSRHEAGLDAGVMGLRIGIPDRYYVDDLDDAVAAAFDAARAALARIGAQVVPVAIPDQLPFLALADLIWAPEAAAVHHDRLTETPEAYGEQVRTRLLAGAQVTGAANLRAPADRDRAIAAMLARPFAACDLLLTPAARMRVPHAEDVAPTRGEAVHRMVADLSRFTRPASMLGFPALVTPMGIDPDGLPLALQLIGPPGAEPLLLRAGHAFEHATGWLARRPPPIAPPLQPSGD